MLPNKLFLRYRQYFYCICAITTVGAAAIHESWSSPFLPQLQTDDSPIGVKLESVEASTVVIMYNAGIILGSVLTIWGMDIFGRKAVIVTAGSCDLISWTLMYFASGLAMLCVSRFLGGIAITLSLNCGAIYLGEISHNDNRGGLNFLMTLFKILGTDIGFIIGPYVSFKTFATLSLCVSIVSATSTLFIPESPYHLIKKGNNEEANRVIRKLATDASDESCLQKEFEGIRSSVEQDMQIKGTIGELLTKKMYRKSLCIHICLMVIAYFSGNSIIRSYIQTIINATGSSLSSNTASVVFGICNYVAALVSAQIVDRFGRKPLLMVSCLLCSMSMFSLGLYFYFQNTYFYNMDAISWLPVTSVVLFEVFVVIGILSIPYVVAAELYPINIKAAAVSVATLLSAPLGIGVQFSFKPLAKILGVHTCFWFFSCFCILGLLFGIFILPETKGKSFDEIQRILHRPKNEKTIDNKSQETQRF